jgi:hypothetical protein
MPQRVPPAGVADKTAERAKNARDRASVKRKQRVIVEEVQRH